MTEEHAEDLLRVLRKWQASPHVPGETCSADPAHGKRVPELRQDPIRVVLRCMTCGDETPPVSIALLDLEAQLDAWDRAATEGKRDDDDD
jgi:hypothetical protein